jgi:hypothetical protein
MMAKSGGRPHGRLAVREAKFLLHSWHSALIHPAKGGRGVYSWYSDICRRQSVFQFWQECFFKQRTKRTNIAIRRGERNSKISLLATSIILGTGTGEIDLTQRMGAARHALTHGNRSAK